MLSPTNQVVSCRGIIDHLPVQTASVFCQMIIRSMLLFLQDYPRDRHPGWNKGSIAYHAGALPFPSFVEIYLKINHLNLNFTLRDKNPMVISDDGKIFIGSGVGDPFGPRCHKGRITIFKAFTDIQAIINSAAE